MVDSQGELIWQQETWLRQKGGLRRPMAREHLSQKEFERQRRVGVIYTIYEWVNGTYSDGQGGRRRWRRL
jgi:hypothetical protein